MKAGSRGSKRSETPGAAAWERILEGCQSRASVGIPRKTSLTASNPQSEGKMKYLRNEKGQLIGQIQETENQTFIRDGAGRLKGRYLKSVDRTLDGQGRFRGKGDQLLRMLDK
jgi:hypothetical protein